MSSLCEMVKSARRWICPAVLSAMTMPLLVSCSNERDVAGGTEAESTIALQVQLADGSPAAFTRVCALPEGYLSDGEKPAEWTETDGEGFVKIPAEPGVYTVEARHVAKSVATGAVMKFTLEENASRVDTVKLGELSSIEGYVLLGDSSFVVRIAGLDRFVVPDSTGHFVIDSLPSGRFDVQFGDPQEARSTKVSSETGDTLYVVCSDSSADVVNSVEISASKYPAKDWKMHDALLEELEGDAAGTLGATGVSDSLGNIEPAEGEICIVTTTEDYIIVEDTTEVDSLGNATTTAVIAPGSLRECAYKDGPTWVLFEKSGTYNLQSPLRLKKDKTIDGRGRDIRITGMGVLTDVSSNLIFENLTFTAPAITVLDTSSRRALSIHNGTHHVWVDHCTFEEYPLVELDVKRGSHNVTVSWSRFENAQTGILFGLTPDLVDESEQTFSMHHNYFANLDASAVRAHRGKVHAYNNFFMDMGGYGVECTDSARCNIEKNVFNVDKTVLLVGGYDEEEAPVDSTVGVATLTENWFMIGAGEIAKKSGKAFKPEYKYSADAADADLAWKVKGQSGPR